MISPFRVSTRFSPSISPSVPTSATVLDAKLDVATYPPRWILVASLDPRLAIVSASRGSSRALAITRFLTRRRGKYARVDRDTFGGLRNPAPLRRVLADDRYLHAAINPRRDFYVNAAASEGDSSSRPNILRRTRTTS